jgi:exosortase
MTSLQPESPSPAGGGHFGGVRRPALALFAIVAVLAAALYAPVFLSYGATWLSFPEYNYGFAVPVVALYLLARRWRELRAQPLEPDARGGLLLAVGLAVLLLGKATGIHQADGLSFIPAALGLVWFLWGRGAARVVLFPVSYLLCGFGIVHSLHSDAGFALQQITARYAAVLATLLGAHTDRVGLVLTVDHHQFVVAQACSDLGSLLSLLALGWLIVGEGPGSLRTKALLGLAIAPLAVLANILRVALVLVLSQDVSPAVAEGFVHSAFSVSIFALTLLLLLALRKGLLWLDRSAMV